MGYISGGDGLDAVHFSGFDQGADAAPYNAAYVVAGEERIPAVQGHDFVIMNSPRRWMDIRPGKNYGADPRTCPITRCGQPESFRK